MKWQWTRTDAEDKPFTLWALALGRKPQGMPEAYWCFLRRAWPVFWLGIVLVAIGGLMGVRLVFRGGRSIGELQEWVMSCCVIAGALVAGVTPVLLKRRFRRKLNASGYALCLRCGYRLDGLPAKHKCPECGEEFDVANVKTEWERWERRLYV